MQKWESLPWLNSKLENRFVFFLFSLLPLWILFNTCFVYAEENGGRCNYSLSQPPQQRPHWQIKSPKYFIIDGISATEQMRKLVQQKMEKWRHLFLNQLLYNDQYGSIYFAFKLEGKTYYSLLYRNLSASSVFTLEIKILNSDEYLKTQRRSGFSRSYLIKSTARGAVLTWGLEQKTGVSGAIVMELVANLDEQYFQVQNKLKLLLWEFKEQLLAINFVDKVAAPNSRYRQITSIAQVEQFKQLGYFRVAATVQQKIQEKHGISSDQLVGILSHEQYRFAKDNNGRKKVYKSLVRWPFGKHYKILRLVFRFATDQRAPILITLFPINESGKSGRDEIIYFDQHARLFVFQGPEGRVLFPHFP